ncbi:hypothetical protein OTU49_015029 [Cherax quadricarinatus]|uniref:C-type lectin domain-containing protein n=1 Tax=Cherax quadricarinatus TaxID=27406 RepID=A0AAW0YL28_CHEQU
MFLEVVVVAALVGTSMGDPTSTFLMVAQDVKPPNLSAIITTPAGCSLACYAAGAHQCLGFLWRSLSTASDIRENGCLDGTVACVGAREGRCSLLECVPDPSTLVPFPGAQLFLLRGQKPPPYGSIRAPASYTMACTFAYRVFNNVKLRYEEAERRCAQDGAQLIAIKSEEQQLVVLKSIQREAYWIGLTDRHKEGDWLLSDGSRPSYFKWDKGQPNNYKKYDHDQDCVMLFQGAWNDNQCNQQLSFICQIPFLEL